MDSDVYLPIVHGFGVAIGFLLAGWAIQISFWRMYMRANPSTTVVSTSGGVFIPILFVLGVMLAYISFMSGLRRVFDVE
jgi:hypothetical protein